MPAVVQGKTTTPSTAPWAATTGYTSGDNVQPSPATGQYFQATASGTSGGSQPPWSTPTALPVPGSTFIDGTVTWTCMGSIVAAPTAIAVDEPLDTDPNTVASIDRGLTNLANNIAWLFKNTVTTSRSTYSPGTFTPTISPFDTTTISGPGAYTVLNFATGLSVVEIFNVLIDLGSSTYTAGTYYQFVVSVPVAFGTALESVLVSGEGASQFFVCGPVGSSTTTVTIQWTPTTTFTGGGSTVAVFNILAFGY